MTWWSGANPPALHSDNSGLLYGNCPKCGKNFACRMTCHTKTRGYYCYCGKCFWEASGKSKTAKPCEVGWINPLKKELAKKRKGKIIGEVILQ